MGLESGGVCYKCVIQRFLLTEKMFKMAKAELEGHSVHIKVVDMDSLPKMPSKADLVPTSSGRSK
jgi:hypothetical protein